MPLSKRCLTSEANMKMKSKLQNIIEEHLDETFDDCDQTSPILLRDCDFATQIASVAKAADSSKDDPAINLNHRP